MVTTDKISIKDLANLSKPCKKARCPNCKREWWVSENQRICPLCLTPLEVFDEQSDLEKSEQKISKN